MLCVTLLQDQVVKDEASNSQAYYQNIVRPDTSGLHSCIIIIMMHLVAREVFRLLLGNKAKVSLVKGPLSRMYLAVVV